MKRATLISVRVKSCNVLLRLLPACIRSYLKSILRRKFLILVTSRSDILYLIQQGREDPWLFLEAKRSARSKNLGETDMSFSPVFCLIISDDF
jgi:hypothetical protein